MQGSEFLDFYHLKLVNKIDEMLKTSVEVSLSWEKHDMLEMGMVDVSIYSEKTFENYFDYASEVTRELHTNLARENFFII